MGVRLDGKLIIVRRGDRLLIATGSDGMPQLLSVMIQIKGW
jgi:hypothetical protein